MLNLQSSSSSPPPSSFQVAASSSMDTAEWIQTIAGDDPDSPTPMLLDNVSTSLAPASATSTSTSPSQNVADVHRHHQILSHDQQYQPVPPAPLDRKPQQLRPQHGDPLRCPRCDSVNTKFCYYNNYSLSQPRYFCKTCRRYWTKGGSLRNVPVGGGCRRSKRGAKNGKFVGATAAAPAPASGEIYGHHLALPLPLNHFSPTATAAHTQAALGTLFPDPTMLLEFATGGPTGNEQQLPSAATFSALFPQLSFVGGRTSPQPTNFKGCKYEQQSPIYDALLNQQQHLYCSGDVAAAVVPPATQAQFLSFEAISSAALSAGNDISGIHMFGAFHSIDPSLGSSADNSGVNHGETDHFRTQQLALPWTLHESADNEYVIEAKPAARNLLSLEWQLDQQSGCDDTGAAEHIGPFSVVSSSTAAVRMWGEELNGYGVHGPASATESLI